jgi:hypothetical protein
MKITAVVLVIAVAGVLFVGRQGFQRWRTRRVQVAAASAGLRLAVLNREFVDASAVGEPNDIRCVVMDWNLGGESVATLVAFEDGTTSLYLSSGGGVIGAGEHERVRQAAAEFRAAAANVRDRFAPTDNLERPPSGHSRFFIVTRSQTLASPPLSKGELQQQNTAFAQLAAAAQATITEIRRAS